MAAALAPSQFRKINSPRRILDKDKDKKGTSDFVVIERQLTGVILGEQGERGISTHSLPTPPLSFYAGWKAQVRAS